MKKLEFGGTAPVPDLTEFNSADVRVGLKLYDRSFGHDSTVVGVSGNMVRIEYPIYGADVPDGAMDVAAFDMDYIVNGHYASAAQLECLRGQKPELPVISTCPKMEITMVISSRKSLLFLVISII